MLNWQAFAEDSFSICSQHRLPRLAGDSPTPIIWALLLQEAIALKDNFYKHTVLLALLEMMRAIACIYIPVFREHARGENAGTFKLYIITLA